MPSSPEVDVMTSVIVSFFFFPSFFSSIVTGWRADHLLLVNLGCAYLFSGMTDMATGSRGRVRLSWLTQPPAFGMCK